MKALERLLGRRFGDKLRIHNTVVIEHIDADGRLIHSQTKHNLITNAGRNWLCGIMGDASGNPAKYIALTANSTAAGATDTTLTGEYTDSGLSRAVGTYAHTADNDSFTITKEFTATADDKTIAKAGLFTAASDGTLFSEIVFAEARTLDTGEKLNVIWTIDLGL